MNTFNVIIQGNYDDIRGDAVVYLLERAASGSCKVWVSGTTGSVSGNTIINHKQGNFTASVGQMGWNGSYGDDFINRVCNSSSPAFDIIIYPKLEGDWTASISSSLTALSLGIPIFTPHYNDTSSFEFEVNNFYGFFPSFIAGWGNYLTGNSGSYGNQLEFIDSVIDGANLSQSILLYGDNKGLSTTENSIYFDNLDVSVNSLYAPVSLAAKYINLVQALSSSYNPNSVNTQIYSSYLAYLNNGIINSRKNFLFDLRQYLRQVSTSGSNWSYQYGYGIAQILNYSGSNPSMPNFTSSYDLNTLGAGTPLYITYTTQSFSGSTLFTFNWQNYLQSNYKDTVIKINGRVVYKGNEFTYTWNPDITTQNAVATFYTELTNGLVSSPESNSIINLGIVQGFGNTYSGLNYGYSCANNGKYIVVGSLNNDSLISSNGVVDVFQYDNTYNKYINKFLIRKLVTNVNYNLILATEDNTIYQDNTSGSAFLDTEFSSSYDIPTYSVLITEPNGSSFPNYNIDTEPPLQDFIIGNTTVPLTNDAMDLQTETVLELVDSYSDNFGKSLDLSGDVLAVGCPNFNINFRSGDKYIAGSVDIYDLTKWESGIAFVPTASIASDGNLTFGESISFSSVSSITGSLYLAIGSSAIGGNFGAVYIYKRINNDNTNWNLIQTIYGPTSNAFFGGSVKFDKSGNGYTLVVGNSNKSNNNTNVYVYEMQNEVWSLSANLTPDNTILQTLPYLNNLPPILLPNTNTGFGNSVSIYGNDIIVGSPTDTIYTEFLDSSNYSKTRGAVYFYHRCNNNAQWQLIKKSWGDADTMINNNLGYAVDIYNGTAITTVLKPNTNYTANYIINTLYKNLDCNPDDSIFDTVGQTLMYEYNISSSNWDIYFTQQKLKEYGYPYLNYGYCTSLYEQSFVVGSPCYVSDYTNLSTNFNSNIQGYAYVYNLNNLQTNHHVGNVFYRDGKIILSNSGSVFDKLMKNKYVQENPAYNLQYTTKLDLYEKQIVCTINPGEFNFSTNPTSMINNKYFEFKNLDRILKYINNLVNGNYYWWQYIPFNAVEQSLFNMYVQNYDILNESIAPYYNNLSSSYSNWDVDGNDKINFNDMILIWKCFTNTLTQDDVFACVEPKSIRKTLTDIQFYIQNNIIIKQYGQINPQFFDYVYSSSIDLTGSYLAPYITTIGLYNGADLVAVAKLAQPIKNGGEFPLNILIKWDL
jgi:hypothetical protein